MSTNKNSFFENMLMVFGLLILVSLIYELIVDIVTAIRTGNVVKIIFYTLCFVTSYFICLYYNII
jgi:hypothetical protein